jgi:hypothetical protein
VNSLWIIAALAVAGTVRVRRRAGEDEVVAWLEAHRDQLRRDLGLDDGAS